MADTSPAAGTGFVNPFGEHLPFTDFLTFPVHAAGEVYDGIMEKIEPELVSSVIPILREKYAAETSEQAKARAERYGKAFAEYEKQFAQYMSELHEQAHEYERSALASAEKQEGATDAQKLSGLEDAMTNS